MSITFITGCGKGLGLTFLEETLNKNQESKVVGIYRSTPPRISTGNNSRLILVKGDAASESTITEALERSKVHFGAFPERFVVNAGVRLRKDLIDCCERETQELWSTNYFSLREIIRSLVSRGLTTEISLVYISSIVAHRGFVDLDDYGASKAAGESLIRSTAAKYSQMRLNSIALGFTETSYAESFKRNRPELFEWTVERTVQNRWASCEEICGAIEFLLSDDSKFITGTTLNVDGGWLSNA